MIYRWLLMLTLLGAPVLTVFGCGGVSTEGMMEDEPEHELTEEEIAGEEEYIQQQ